jgi:hypothetical protein
MQLKDYQVVGVLCLSVDSWGRYDIMIHGNVETAGDSFFCEVLDRASHKVPSRSSERSMKVPNFN